jgi:hypothetical protein
MKARVVMATINGIQQWRVYYEQKPIALFEQEDWAQKYADYLNTNYFQNGNK